MPLPRASAYGKCFRRWQLELTRPAALAAGGRVGVRVAALPVLAACGAYSWVLSSVEGSYWLAGGRTVVSSCRPSCRHVDRCVDRCVDCRVDRRVDRRVVMSTVVSSVVSTVVSIVVSSCRPSYRPSCGPSCRHVDCRDDRRVVVSTVVSTVVLSCRPSCRHVDRRVDRRVERLVVLSVQPKSMRGFVGRFRSILQVGQSLFPYDLGYTEFFCFRFVFLGNFSLSRRTVWAACRRPCRWSSMVCSRCADPRCAEVVRGGIVCSGP